ncbi:MAG: hypothetical protein L0Z50_32405 [Verrucomicrobiales bacterium]|nr:hypothetical protein [Verrucomicrobiales bacterium]
MNPPINERLSLNSTQKPELISARARELLNLRRLPAMLNAPQTAAMLNLSEHDIPVLIRADLLNPVGKPPPNAMKYFATVQIMELAGEIAQLSRIRSAVYEHWQRKNAAKSRLNECPASDGQKPSANSTRRRGGAGKSGNGYA